MELLDFPGGAIVKNPPANAGNTGSIPGSGRSLEGKNGNRRQYSCLENSMAGYSRWGHRKSDRTKRRNMHTQWSS